MVMGSSSRMRGNIRIARIITRLQGLPRYRPLITRIWARNQTPDIRVRPRTENYRLPRSTCLHDRNKHGLIGISHDTTRRMNVRIVRREIRMWEV